MIRIGQGYDVHRLVPDRPLIIGGVTIPFELGLAGHSDADVLLHAVTDALLGAAALGDIGTHFPPSDERWRGVDSREFLRVAGEMLQQAGWRINNIDSTIVAERPKMAPYIPQMREVIANVLGISTEQVSVKAKTSEKLGFVGNGEGIEAFVSVLVEAVAS